MSRRASNGERWRRRELYQDEPRAIAHSAITAHAAPLCSLFVVRRGDIGAERLVVLLHGFGRGIGPWEDTVLDLATGEELIISSEDPEWTARRATVAELPPAWLKVWPRHNGRLVTPGQSDSSTGAPDERWFQRRAGKLDAGAGQLAIPAETDRSPSGGTPRTELAGTDRSASPGTPRGRRAWKPDATGQRCSRCARTWAGHAGRSCYPVPHEAIDAFDPPRPDLLEALDAAGRAPAGGTHRRGPATQIADGGEDLHDGLPPSTRHTSARSPRDASAGSPGRLCAWCGEPIPEVSAAGRRTRADAETCGVVCRKRRHRFQRAVHRAVPPRPARSPRDASRLAGAPARFGYADPPYPGCAGYYHEHQEVDHRQLVARLEAEFPDGWALSTSAAALRDVLCFCPPGTRVCAWRRRVRVTRSKRALSAWEPLIVSGGRELATDSPQQLLDDLETADVILDELETDAPEDALDYRGRYDSYGGALVGMKPPEFAVWMFAQLGARPGDTLEDLYPGSGAIGRAWELYTALDPLVGPRDGSGDASLLEPRDPSRSAAAIRPAGLADTSRLATAARDA
jgi:hypothetical protein